MPNTEFEITEVVITSTARKYNDGTVFSVIDYSFRLRRASLSYLLGSVLPLMVVTLVGICGLFMGGLSYGRVYLGITAMLTTTSIYTVVSQQIPDTTEFTFVSLLYVFCFANGLIIIMQAILVSSLVFVWQEDSLSKGYLQHVFNCFDTDATGSLDVDEVRRALYELGLSEVSVNDCILRLNFNNEGKLPREQWFYLSDLLGFDSKGKKALARHHNPLTGAMLDWAIARDQQDMEKIGWKRETIQEDLALYTSIAHAAEACRLFRKLCIAGNYSELKHTRDLLAYTDGSSEKCDHRLAFEKAKLDRKLYFIAQSLHDMSHKKLPRNLSVNHLPGVSTAALQPAKTREAAAVAAADVPQHAPWRHHLSEMEIEVELIRKCLYRALMGRSAPNEHDVLTQKFEYNVVLPASPNVRHLVGFDAVTLERFLHLIRGDLAHKARFAKYAPQMRRLEMDGSCIQSFGPQDLAAMEVEISDREALLLGIKLLYRIYEASDKYMHQVEIRVLRADNLPVVDTNGRCDAYCVIKLDHARLHMRQEFTSTYHRNSLNPTWKNQHCRVRIPAFDDPGELTIHLYDHNHFTADDLIGGHNFGEAVVGYNLQSLPLLGQMRSRKVVWFSEVLSALKARVVEHAVQMETAANSSSAGHVLQGEMSEVDLSPVKLQETLLLYRDGVPVASKNGKVSSVTVEFSLPQGYQRELQLSIQAGDYPHSAGVWHRRIKFHVFLEQPIEAVGEGEEGGQSKEESRHSVSVWSQDEGGKQNLPAHIRTAASNFGQPSPSRSHVPAGAPQRSSPTLPVDSLSSARADTPTFVEQQSPLPADLPNGHGTRNAASMTSRPSSGISSPPPTISLNLQEDGADTGLSPTRPSPTNARTQRSAFSQHSISLELQEEGAYTGLSPTTIKDAAPPPNTPRPTPARAGVAPGPVPSAPARPPMPTEAAGTGEASEQEDGVLDDKQQWATNARPKGWRNVNAGSGLSEASNQEGDEAHKWIRHSIHHHKTSQVKARRGAGGERVQWCRAGGKMSGALRQARQWPCDVVYAGICCGGAP